MGAVWPNGSRTKKPRRTREFGFRSSIYKRGWHTGWDTAEPGYDRNCSPERGIVVGRYYDGSYGNTVLVRHHDGVVSRTAHGSAFLVALGQEVGDGQELLVQGTTGMSTGKHNHQEIIAANGEFLNPETWIPSRGSAPAPAPAPAGDGRILGYFDTPSGDVQFYYWHLGNALRGLYASNQWLRGGQTLAVVEDSGRGPVKVLCAYGDTVWVGTANHPAQWRRNTAAPAPERIEWFDVPEEGQFFYKHLENALTGNYAPDQLLPGWVEREGRMVRLSVRVTGDSGQGPRQVLHPNLVDKVWVGTRRNPASTRWS